MTSSNECLLRFNGDEGQALVVEDDGRVAYAYLMVDERVAGDVWLYNRVATPTSIDWRNKEELPFLNPEKYALESNGFTIDSSSDCSCQWTPNQVDLLVGGVWVARLKVGAKPGWSFLARIPGPLARPIAEVK